MRGFGTFGFRSLELVSDFEIRASDLAPGGGCWGKMCKTKPNLEGLGYVGKDRYPVEREFRVAVGPLHWSPGFLFWPP
jgi:hypothetical protein